MKRRATPIALVALVALFVAVACGAGAATVDRSALFLSAAPSPEGRTCHAAGTPVTLPSADAVVDSVAVMNGVKAQPGEPAGYALFSLQFDNQGHVVSLHTIEANLSQERRVAVEQLTVNRVRVQTPGNPWSIRMKVTSDSAPRVQVGRSELCPAILRGPLDVVISRTIVSGRDLQRMATSTSPVGLNPTGPHFLVLVDSTGRLIDSKLTQSSGQSSIDEQYESGMRDKGFRPTLLDGVPILAWTKFPLEDK